VSPNANKKTSKTFIINVIEAFFCCRGRTRTFIRIEESLVGIVVVYPMLRASFIRRPFLVQICHI
jgi:hypothetical protein